MVLFLFPTAKNTVEYKSGSLKQEVMKQYLTVAKGPDAENIIALALIDTRNKILLEALRTPYSGLTLYYSELQDLFKDKTFAEVANYYSKANLNNLPDIFSQAYLFKNSKTLSVYFSVIRHEFLLFPITDTDPAKILNNPMLGSVVDELTRANIL